jgi:cysteinyl-tRNA synthetase
MDDDFNVPLAMGVVFGGVKDCNRELKGKRPASCKRSEESIKARYLDICRICHVVFGLTLEPKAESSASRRKPITEWKMSAS